MRCSDWHSITREPLGHFRQRYAVVPPVQVPAVGGRRHQQVEPGIAGCAVLGHGP